VVEPLEQRPALDGVRTIAVYIVIAFHAGVSSMGGGYLGVDIFFVLSGYLVTRVMLTDLGRDSFTLRSFYGRRVRRLLPASLVVLAAVSVTWLLVMGPTDRTNLIGDVRSAALYYSNWHFIAQSTDYFAAQNDPSPVLHFWSLSVEEQFYLFWPVLLLLGWKVSRRRPLAIGALAGILAAASLIVLALTIRAGDANMAYYGTHVRVYQLLGGALLGVGIQYWSWARRPSVLVRLAPVIQLLALAGIGLLASSAMPTGEAARGVYVALATLVLLWALEAGRNAPASRVLGLSLIAYLGQISYGTYLWHYPVIVLLRHFAEISPFMLMVFTILLGTALAALSQRVLELPIRRSRALGRHSRSVVSIALLTSVICGLLVFPAILRSTRPVAIHVASDSSGTGVSVPAGQRVPATGVDWKATWSVPPGSGTSDAMPPDVSCTHGVLANCMLVPHGNRRVLLMGDSHAMMLVPALRLIAEQNHWQLAIAAVTGCPWQPDLVFSDSNHGECLGVKKTWYDSVIPKYKPALILMITRATDHKIGGDYSVESTAPEVQGTDESDLLINSTRIGLQRLAAPGRTLAVIDPVPVSPVNTASCLEQARYVDECSFVTEPLSRAELAYHRFTTQLPRVRDVDIDPLVCPRLPVCDAVLSGVEVRKDHDHITPRWSFLMAPGLATLLRQDGIL
jgi:peptidoglycan/LPS O-acetylase OafA/YrhL